MLKHVRASDDWHDKNIGQKGFTLIELLVVIIILGILAGIVVLAVGGLQESGDQKACETEVRTIESASAAYYADHNETWPPNQAALLSTTDPLGGPYMQDPPSTTYTIVDGQVTAPTC